MCVPLDALRLSRGDRRFSWHNLWIFIAGRLFRLTVASRICGFLAQIVKNLTSGPHYSRRIRCSKTRQAPKAEGFEALLSKSPSAFVNKVRKLLFAVAECFSQPHRLILLITGFALAGSRSHAKT